VSPKYPWYGDDTATIHARNRSVDCYFCFLRYLDTVFTLRTELTTPAAFKGYPDTDSKQWRVSLGVQIIPAGLLALLIMAFPESPRWLIDNGQPEVGLVTLARLHANGDTSDAWVQTEYHQIKEQLAIEHEQEAKSYRDLFIDKSTFRRLILAVAIQASIQMTGVSAIQYYSVTIFKQIGIDETNTLRYQIYNSIIALFGQVCCMMLIDRLGRRWPLILGNLGNMVTFIVATYLLASFPPESNHNEKAAWGFISMTWLYNFSFSSTCGPLSWIIPAEIFDTRMRAKGVSIATMTSFAFNTLIGQTTPIAMKSIGWRWYFLFCVSHSRKYKNKSLQLLFRCATLPMHYFSGHSSQRLNKGLLRR
jgi:hypothetical protein